MNFMQIIEEHSLLKCFLCMPCRVCKVFRNITNRAEATPDSTEQLMATGEFMSRAEQQLLGELEQRIRGSVHHMGFLMRLRYLSPQHTKLNTETVQWLSRIQPTFVRSATVRTYES